MLTRPEAGQTVVRSGQSPLPLSSSNRRNPLLLLVQFSGTAMIDASQTVRVGSPVQVTPMVPSQPMTSDSPGVQLSTLPR